MKTNRQQQAGRVKAITSLTNPEIKALKALSQKKHRERGNVFLAEGLKFFQEAMALNWPIRTMVYAKSQTENELVSTTAAHARALGADILEVNNRIMSAITRRDNPLNVVGVFDIGWAHAETVVPTPGELVLALDRVRDPGNLGTIIRTADATGVKAIVLIGDVVDPFGLETVRASMGSIFAVPLLRMTEPAFLKWVQTRQIRLVGTHLSGSVPFQQLDCHQTPAALVMGNEQSGMSEGLTSACDEVALIAQTGRADSLNLAVATGVMLYQLRRQALGIV